MEFLSRYVYKNIQELPVPRQFALIALLAHLAPISFRYKVALTVCTLASLFFKEEERVVMRWEWPEMYQALPVELLEKAGFCLAGLVLVIIGVTGLCVVLYTMKFLFWMIRRLVFNYRFRTIRRFRPEALREGSLFEPGTTPGYQVPVLDIGLFSNETIGYGLRLEDYLIVPTHVLESVQWPQNELAIGCGKRVMLLDMERYQDPLFDVSYFRLTPAQWAMLGASKGSFVNDVASDGTRVWCVGKRGKSHGLLKQSSSGMYVYTGSTVPGMSGAAYEGPGGVLGMHVGASGTENLGISSVYLWRRQELLFQEESKRNRGVTGLQAYDNPGMLMEQAQKRWGAGDVNDLIFAAKHGAEDVTAWLDRHHTTLGVHRYSYENQEPKVVKKITEEVVQPTPCFCKELFHSCEAKRGLPNVGGARVAAGPSTYVGQAGGEILVEPSVGMIEARLNQVVHRQDLVDTVIEDHSSALQRLTGENQELRDKVAFLEKRLTVMEVWTIDRGYMSLPPEVLTPQSPQTLAIQNRRNATTPDIPKKERVKALPLTHKDRYVGESSRKIVTPPMIRKVKKAVAQVVKPAAQLAKTEPPQEMVELRVSMDKKYQQIRDKQNRSKEEMAWMQEYLVNRRARNAQRRKNKRSSPSSQSSSSSTTK